MGRVAPDERVRHPEGAESGHFIRASAQDTAPFFAYVALQTPHPPAKPPARYADRYPNLGVPRTRDYNEKNVSDKPYWIRTAPRVSSKGKDAADKLYRNRARSLLKVDDMMERLYTALQETGELDNTYIIFTSQHISQWLGSWAIASMLEIT